MNAVARVSDESFYAISIDALSPSIKAFASTETERAAGSNSVQSAQHEPAEWDAWARKVRSNYEGSLRTKFAAVASIARYTVGPHPAFTVPFVLAGIGGSFVLTRLF